MADTQAKASVQKVVPFTFNDLMWTQQNDLRGEMREGRKELSERMLRLEYRQDKLEEKIETVRRELNTRMDKLDEKIDKVNRELNTRMDKLDEKIDKVNRDLNARMDKQDAKIEKLDEKIDTMSQEINKNINELRKDIQTSSNHGNIMTASVLGIAIAVVYSIFK